MTEFTEAKLAELRAVAEAATLPAHYVCDCTALCGGVCPNPKPVYLSIDNETVLALIDALEAANESNPSNSFTSGTANERELTELHAALEAKTAEVDAKADYVSDLEERVRQRDNHVIPVLHARIKEAERERDEARAEASKIEGRAVEWSKRAETAEAALERVRALHRKAHAIFSWSEGGVRYEEPCENCNGAPGVHDCGCWADVQVEYVCAECDRDKGKHRDSGWPCETITQALTMKED